MNVSPEFLQHYEEEAKAKHLGSTCLDCSKRSWEHWPNPCKSRKRWQNEGTCRDKPGATVTIKRKKRSKVKRR